jgi:hypothetical protein
VTTFNNRRPTHLHTDKRTIKILLQLFIHWPLQIDLHIIAGINITHFAFFHWRTSQVLKFSASWFALTPIVQLTACSPFCCKWLSSPDNSNNDVLQHYTIIPQYITVTSLLFRQSFIFSNMRTQQLLFNFYA